MSRSETVVDSLSDCFKRPRSGDGGVRKRRFTRQWSLHSYIGEPSSTVAPSMAKRCESLPMTRQSGIKLVREEEIHEMFENMLDEMNLSEDKKVPLRKRDSASKIEIMNLHVTSVNLVDGKLTCLDDYVRCLSHCAATNMSSNKVHQLMESVRVASFSKPLSWLEEFAIRGLDHLTAILHRFCCKRDGKHEKIIQECIRCYRALLAAKTSTDLLLKSYKPVRLVVKCIDKTYVSNTIEALRFVGDLCYSLQKGLWRVLDVLSFNQTSKRLSRFEPILECLLDKENYGLLTVTLRCINAIINSSEDDEIKLNLRDELMRDGLFGVVNELDEIHNREVRTQLYIFWDDAKSSKCYEFERRKSLLRQAAKAALVRK